MRLISKQDAITEGLKRYYTGVPCRRGHDCQRRIAGDCVECARLNAKSLSPEKKLAKALRQKKWNEDNAERQKANIKKWREWNKEHRAETNAAYRASSRDKIRAAAQKWKKENPERSRLYAHNRRASKVGELSGSIVRVLWTKQLGLCACPCRRPLREYGFHVDHITALINGGSNTDSNVQLLTPECNILKWKRDNKEFMAAQETKYANP